MLRVEEEERILCLATMDYLEAVVEVVLVLVVLVAVLLIAGQGLNMDILAVIVVVIMLGLVVVEVLVRLVTMTVMDMGETVEQTIIQDLRFIMVEAVREVSIIQLLGMYFQAALEVWRWGCWDLWWH